MTLLIILLILFAVFGFGHTGYRRGWYGGGYGYEGPPPAHTWGGGGIGLILLLVVLFLLFGHHHY